METESGCFFSTKDILPSNSWCCRAPGRDGCRNLAQVVLKDVGFVPWVDTWPRKKNKSRFFLREHQKSQVRNQQIPWYKFCFWKQFTHPCIGHVYTIDIYRYADSSCRPLRGAPPDWKNTREVCCGLYVALYSGTFRASGGKGGEWALEICQMVGAEEEGNFGNRRSFFFGVKNHDE